VNWADLAGEQGHDQVPGNAAAPVPRRDDDRAKLARAVFVTPDLRGSDDLGSSHRDDEGRPVEHRRVQLFASNERADSRLVGFRRSAHCPPDRDLGRRHRDTRRAR